MKNKRKIIVTLYLLTSVPYVGKASEEKHRPQALHFLRMQQASNASVKEIEKNDLNPHNEKIQAVQKRPDTSKSASIAVIGLGCATTLIGYVWFLATSWAEEMICRDRMEPCDGSETYKINAQLLMAMGVTTTVAGGVSLLDTLE
jgi:hypothetical protein